MVLLNQTKKVIANKFCEYFQQMGEKATRDCKNKAKLNVRVKQKKIKSIQDSMYLYPPTLEEVNRCIENLKEKTSSGYDGISNKMLKELRTVILKPLYDICKSSILEAKFPECMKLAIVKPLYKKNSKLEIENYRPISLLLVISKILEQLIYVRLIQIS